MKVTFVGGGNMANAMIGGLIKQGWTPAAITVVEIAAEARERLEAHLNVKTTSLVDAAAVAADCLVLAVKPQQMHEAAQALAPFLRAQLVITIAAGIRVADLSRWLGGYSRIVRVMPNTPALVLAGVSGLYASPTATADDRAAAERILAAVGATIWLEREGDLDAVTAVSGSGPAYVFYFIEALEQAATELGLPSAAARKLALETFAGAAKLAHEASEAPGALRARVTSKGGTTERALLLLEADRVKDAISRAVRAAAERSRELGDELSED